MRRGKNGREAFEQVEKHKPHIAFLDIKMPGLSGMAVAKGIAVACRVVFITAYDQYAVEPLRMRPLTIF